MPTHAREAVVAAVQERLEQIAVGTGEWAMVDQPVVHRFRGIADIAEVFPIFFIVVANESKKRQGSEGLRTMYHCDLTLTFECWIEGTDLDVEISKVVHDVELALGTDHTQGGVCIDTEVQGNIPQYSETEETRAVVFITVLFQYRHLDNTPDVVR